MPKALRMKTSVQLRHEPLGNEIQKPTKKFRAPRASNDNDPDMEMEMEDNIPSKISSKIMKQAQQQQREEMNENYQTKVSQEIDNDDDNYEDLEDENEQDYDEQLVEFEGDYVTGNGLSEAEDLIVQRFLQNSKIETRTLADIIMDKIKEKQYDNENNSVISDNHSSSGSIPPKVIEVYTAVGKILQHYKSGKLPKALKMLPHLKNWEDVLWLTRPDEWSASATYVCTRIFASNLNAKMAQKFYNIILLEKCRDDIRQNNKLNYHLSLKKALFKPSAFYKGILLPLASSGSCTLREATIIGSILSKVSIQSNHSAAVLLKLIEMEYTGSTSLFVKILLNKKYSLPKLVIEKLISHYSEFVNESRVLPVSLCRYIHSFHKLIVSVS